MTTKEVEIVKFFVVKYNKFLMDWLYKTYAHKLTYSIESFDEMRNSLDLSPQNWGNYKSSLRKKKVFLGDEQIYLNPKILLDQEVTFKFKRYDISWHYIRSTWRCTR